MWQSRIELSLKWMNRAWLEIIDMKDVNYSPIKANPATDDKDLQSQNASIEFF